MEFVCCKHGALMRISQRATCMRLRCKLYGWKKHALRWLPINRRLPAIWRQLRANRVYLVFRFSPAARSVTEPPASAPIDNVEQKFMNDETFLWLNEQPVLALIRIGAVVIAAHIHILAALQNAEWPIGHLRPPVTWAAYGLFTPGRDDAGISFDVRIATEQWQTARGKAKFWRSGEVGIELSVNTKLYKLWYGAQ